MSKGRRCAYCKIERKLTKEHIWPNCIINRMPELQINYLSSKKLFTRSDLVIADVCEDCNNKKLSPLDAYFCSLYDQYFKFYKEDNTPFTFKYSYDLLLRSLLKITYNSSRTVSRYPNDFEKYREVILHGNMAREDVIIKIDIVKPAIVNGQKMYPTSARCGVIRIEDKMPNFLLRVISVNSFYFYIILSKDFIVAPDVVEEFGRVYESIPGTLVQPYGNEIIVDSFSGHNTHSSHIDFLTATKDLHDDYIARKKR